MNTFAFTCGDINGIGPEIVIKSLNKLTPSRNKFIFICPGNVFEYSTSKIKPSFKFKIISEIRDRTDINEVLILNIGDFQQKPGLPTESSGRASFISIQTAFNLTQNKITDAFVTAPISKAAIKMAGINFPGHTEMLAQRSGVKDFVMMFLSKKMNAALLTIHEPISKAVKMIGTELILDKLRIIEEALINDLSISSPKIALLGLNPHAGEGGIIGNEEERIIIPAIRSFKGKSVLFGPFSPDAFFASGMFRDFDLVLGMYHDQVLIPFKMMSFNSGVNYTAGLPVIRTSPDHGTAFDIAGKNLADPSSMLKAFFYAGKIAKNRKNYGGKEK